MVSSTPKRRMSLWVFANISWLTLIPASALYLERQLRSGVYPTEADSVSIPIFGVVTLVVALLLPLNLGWWFLTRKYPGRCPLRTSGGGLKRGQRVVGATGVILAFLCAFASVLLLVDDSRELAPVLLAWCYVCIAMRASYFAGARNAQRETSSNP